MNQKHVEDTEHISRVRIMSLALILASLQGRRAGFSWDSHGERHNPRAAMFVSSPPLLPDYRTESQVFTVLLAISILRKTTKLTNLPFLYVKVVFVV